VKKLLMGFGILAVLMLPSLSTDAYACSCGGIPDIGSSLSRADAVFSGRVVAADMFRARIQVDTVWKGEAGSEITMLTGVEDLGNGMMRSNSCNYSYTAGATYIIFAGGAPNQLLAQGCSRTGLATPELARDLNTVARPKRIGDEIRSCSGTNEIRVAMATPDSKPIPAVTLSAESSGRKYGSITDQSGKSIFAGLQSGEFKITASADGYLAKQSTVNVIANACVEASLYLLPIPK
jgi:hypothetical protein